MKPMHSIAFDAEEAVINKMVQAIPDDTDLGNEVEVVAALGRRDFKGDTIWRHLEHVVERARLHRFMATEIGSYALMLVGFYGAWLAIP